MATKLHLTDRTVRSIVNKARKARLAGKSVAAGDYQDTDLRGFGIRVTPAGHANYQLGARYPDSPNGYPTRRTLGDVFISNGEQGTDDLSVEARGGALTLGEAREKARRWRDLLSRGIDPKTQEERERLENRRRAAITFRAMSGEFLERHVKGEAYCKLEQMAEEFRKAQPTLKLDRDKALRLVIRDPANAKLVAQSKREGIVKKREAERIIDRFVTRWGALNPGEITPPDAAEAIRAIKIKHGPFESYNCFGILSRLYSWGIGAGAYGIEQSVTAGLSPRDIIGEKREQRIRVLDDAELRAVWQATGKLGYPEMQLMRLLVLTGQRLREVADMSWSEIDLAKKLWTIPADRMKGDRAHEVPLAPEALSILKELDDLRRNPPDPRGKRKEGEVLPLWDRGQFVFSTTRGARPIAAGSKLKTKLDNLVKVEIEAIANEAGETLKPMERWTIHDLRRTARTHFSALPVQDLVRELAIAHAKPGLHKVYDQHAYRDEKRELFTLWEQRLSAIVEPPKLADVADLSKARARHSARAKA